MMNKQTVEIRTRVLEPFRSIARILGVSLSEVIGNELMLRANNIENNGGLISGIELENYFTDMVFISRKKAEGIGERLEAFAADESLTKGTGMIATSVVAREDGRFDLKIQRLTPTNQGNRWTEETVFDLGDDNEGEKWKEQTE